MSKTTSGKYSKRIFVSNIECVYNLDGPVAGDIAQKICEISGRAVWYGYDVIILPQQPDSAFLAYAASFGCEPRIVVPAGLSPAELTIRDGFADPLLQGLVQGASVSSFYPDPQLGDFVQAHGGTYDWGDAGMAPVVNNKANYSKLAPDFVAVPDGVVACGIDQIARAVRRRLAKAGKAYVRHTTLGGGFGNRAFTLNDELPELSEIKNTLRGDQPALWDNGTALVEEYLDLHHSPAVTFTTEDGFLYDNLQITQKGKYRGSWSPVPEWICPPGHLKEIGEQSARRMEDLGFTGTANADLGVDTQGRTIGFEFNGRMTGARHAIKVGESLLGPWHTWRSKGHVIKSVDCFVLKHDASFKNLHYTLQNRKLLANTKAPYGVVITIPPVGNVAGIQVHGNGYEATESLYQQMLDSIGDSNANSHDNPLARHADRQLTLHSQRI